MKLISKSLVLALSLVLLLSLIPAVSAQVAVLEPGETATFVVPFTGACAVEGQVKFSDKSIISDVQYDIIGDMDGLVENGVIFLYADDPAGVDAKLSITVTLSSKAPKGSSCAITIEYAVTAAGKETPGSTQTVTHSVTVPEEEETTQPTEPAPTEPEPTKPDNTVKYADTTALKAQIKIAQELTDYEYTKESWAELEEALDNALNLLDSTSQDKVDKATKVLKNAITDLVPMDYTALHEAIDSVGNMENLEEVAEYWTRFVAALENAKAQTTSGDQDAVNAATEELLAAWDALEKAMEEMGQIVYVDNPIEVEPSYDFCNIKAHPIILIIMIVSLCVNVILAVLITVYLLNKRRKTKDSTPLVEYNIEDDTMEINEDILE